jgi:DNA-binding transcriptional regulator YiaG
MSETRDEFVRIRGEMRLSQVELAKLLGVTQPTISRWEQGHTPVDARTMIALKALQAMRAVA